MLKKQNKSPKGKTILPQAAFFSFFVCFLLKRKPRTSAQILSLGLVRILMLEAVRIILLIRQRLL